MGGGSYHRRFKAGGTSGAVLGGSGSAEDTPSPTKDLEPQLLLCAVVHVLVNQPELAVLTLGTFNGGWAWQEYHIAK
jgi:hypothetical protein